MGKSEKSGKNLKRKSEKNGKNWKIKKNQKFFFLEKSQKKPEKIGGNPKSRTVGKNWKKTQKIRKIGKVRK